MKSELKQSWVEALRSGKYRQTKRHLQDRYGHCCLGVLCDLVDPSGWKETDYFSWLVYRGEEGLPPDSLLKEIGLHREQAEELAAMNDDGKNFSQIADRIETTVDLSSY